MRKLLGGLATGLPDFLVEQVVERSEGVPLYAVEMVRMLVDQGHLAYEEGAYRLVAPPDRLDFPDTLHALIASRLDALEPTDRSLLQDASVLGKIFTLEALAAVRQVDARTLQGSLQSLVRKELLVIEGDPWSPERGQYGFVQSLIREVAYGTLARSERRSRHLAAASYFEAMGDELASVVASHLIEAQQASSLGPEADALAARARAALVTAAERSGSLGAHSQALDYFARALEVSEEAGERARLMEKAASSAQKAGAYEVAERYAVQALSSYDSLTDRLGMGRAGTLLGATLTSKGRPGAAVEKMKQILGHVSELESEEDIVGLVAEIASAHMMASEPEFAIEAADRALIAAERLGAARLVTSLFSAKANALHQSGRWLEATALLEGAVALATDLGHLTEQTRAWVNFSNILVLSDPSRALQAARSSLEMARSLGLRGTEGTALVNAGEAATSTGDWAWIQAAIAETDVDQLPDFDRALIHVTEARLEALRGESSAAEEHLRRAKSVIDLVESPIDVASVRESEAIAALADGRLHDAVASAELAQTADPGSVPGIRSYVWAGRAVLWLGDRASAAKLFERLAGRRIHGAWLDSYQLNMEAGFLALDGRANEAVTLYRECVEGFRDLGCPFDLALSQLDFVMLAPDHPEARADAEEAKEIFERLGAKPFLERLGAALSSTAPSVRGRPSASI